MREAGILDVRASGLIARPIAHVNSKGKQARTRLARINKPSSGESELSGNHALCIGEELDGLVADGLTGHDSRPRAIRTQRFNLVRCNLLAVGLVLTEHDAIHGNVAAGRQVKQNCRCGGWTRRYGNRVVVAAFDPTACIRACVRVRVRVRVNVCVCV